MSEVLARIRVRETQGIRRFLYPLSVPVYLKRKVVNGAFGLILTDGRPVSLQSTPMPLGWYRLDFGISLPPLSETILTLVTNSTPISLEDPLYADLKLDGSLYNKQERFAITIGRDASIQSVVYDGIAHLRGPSTILRNGQIMSTTEGDPQENDPVRSNGPLVAGVWSSGCYPDAKSAMSDTEITACKSWATMTHTLQKTQPDDEVVFTLPFAAVSSTLTYDIGPDGVYGKLETKNSDGMTWRMKNHGKLALKWSVATNDRIDYAGTMTKTVFQQKRWFHLVDSSKALAVAITRVPKAFKEMIVKITSEGGVCVTFRMGRKTEDHAEFGVCYHFLNDVPAIAAATNPQSILLPPTVEVLPA